jgi:acetyl-CoA carboxylase carboxyl transferase subunit alpha
LIDRIVAEPLGGAHRDPTAVMQTLRKAIQDTLSELQDKPVNELLEERFLRLMAYGKFRDGETR